MIEPNPHRPGLLVSCRLWLQQHRFGRFMLVGGFNTLATYLIYVGLVLFLAYPIAYTATWVLGVFLSYYLNARFVFRTKLSLAAALQYPLVYVAQYFIGLTLLYVLVELAHISKFVAPIIIVFVSVPLTYVLSRRVIGGELFGKKGGGHMTPEEKTG
jgi:putative flippase GtrA